jgi:membrane-associated HD superfamily phosphohydrolase
LWKALSPGALGSLIGFFLVLAGLLHGNLVKVNLLWSLWAAGTLALLTVCIVYFARRAIWLCLCRSMFLAVFMLSLGIATLLAAIEALAFPASVLLATSALIFLVVCTVVVHVKRTVPYWRLTFAQNTAKKIDLRNGVFFVTTEWAGYPGGKTSKAQHDLIAYSLAPIGAGLGIVISRGFAGTPWLHTFFGAAAFGIFGIAAFSDSEAYFAYKLLELERQIGKPIVMDGYQKGASLPDAGHE